MPIRYPVTQEEFFYNSRWTKEADNLFIALLVDQRGLGEFNPRRANRAALEFCRQILNVELGKNFSLAYCADRLAILQKRYCVFRWMLRKHGFCHCEETGILTAPLHVWDEIFQEEPFSIAYQEFGDPKWDDLRIIFDGLYFAAPNPTEVIDLTSDSEHDGIENHNLMHEPKTPPIVINVESSKHECERTVEKNYLPPLDHGDASSECSVNMPTSALEKVGHAFTHRLARSQVNSPCKGSSSIPPN